MLEKVCQKIPGLKFICIDTICEHLRGSEIGYGERKTPVVYPVVTKTRIHLIYDAGKQLITRNQYYKDVFTENSSRGRHSVKS
jgi:hypothetical protein